MKKKIVIALFSLATIGGSNIFGAQSAMAVEEENAVDIPVNVVEQQVVEPYADEENEVIDSVMPIGPFDIEEASPADAMDNPDYLMEDHPLEEEPLPEGVVQ